MLRRIYDGTHTLQYGGVAMAGNLSIKLLSQRLQRGQQYGCHHGPTHR